MTNKSQAEKREAVAKAFAKLPLLPNIDYEIPSAVDTVLLWTQPVRVDNHYIDIGRSGVEKEIANIARLAADLQAAVRDMHRPTFDILYDQGIRPPDVTAFCLKVRKACEAIDTDPLPAKVSRRKTAVVPQAIAITLAHYFQLLTGKRATISVSPKTNKAGGRFLQLVEEVFDALSIQASAQSCANEAVSRKRAQKNGPISPFGDGLMGD